MATAQPQWQPPPTPNESVRARLPQLSVYNSLTRSKTPFVPLDGEGRKVGWYACGPTVYDDSHLGHARNYVSTDIIRRILSDYFKFDVTFVMNITDVDDKIILAARQQHLLSQWLAEHATVDSDIRDTTTKAFHAYIEKNLPLVAHDTTPHDWSHLANKAYGHVLKGQSLANDGSQPGDKEAKVKMHLRTAGSAAEVLLGSDPSMQNITAKGSGVLLPYIDSLRKHTVTGKDHDIFTILTKRYEQRFFDDMAALNVRSPDQVTRVTEYGPQIVDFVKQIEQNGFAYENEGSVYYDTTSWESTGGVYARLEPWNRNDKELQQDGEGSLSTKKTGFKKSGADFALWKASKEGEPSWESPWGVGRPGWHIECSAMASDVLGKQFDIHSGGIDLAFPHHDNELAQSEAYWSKSGKESKQWVNYFLHMGHLSIQGSKMSKSLKNFTTIREAIAKGDWTPRGLRIVFLLGAWRDGLEITGEVIKAGRAWEDKVDNLFLKIRDVQLREERLRSNKNGITNGINSLTFSDDEIRAVADELEVAKHKFRDALCDSFDTPTAMRVISDLITFYNSQKPSIVPDVIAMDLGRWVTEMVVMLGLDANHKPGQLGWSGLEIPEAAKAFVIPLAQLRDKVREQAKAGGVDITSLGRFDDKDTIYSPNQPYANANADFQRKIIELGSQSAQPKDFLAACDHVRDQILWKLDIYLEDRDGLPALIRPLSQSLREERASKDAAVASKAAAKERAKIDAEAAEKKKLDQGKLSHLDMFRTSEYSAWDSDGLPTHDVSGAEIAKSRAKKLRKDYDRQKKLHETWLGTQRADSV
ncbi:cysteinyl-tRNA synthetase [Elasticomyces elasticus]|nr:cysteinyl-tRNA synthetase [Elasticomyces elasticus]KAK3667285.1 cysteinyl-tRNA synthetase [Elasticomyces elasticus]KAK4932636.1 cysteinyl-tRNA synthetase [Elasticomyces elasticus]KAK5769658.1 cysteinyl-tRNA synthetase [Elasticomyces elasticus]